MVTAEELQTCKQFSAWNSRDLNKMALQLDQNCRLPHFIPSVLTENAALPGQHNSHLLGSNLGQPNGIDGNISFPFGNSSPKDFQPRSGVLDRPMDTSCANGKRFLIFDRSGNHTRLLVGPSFTRQDNFFPFKIPATASVLCKEVASGVVEEKWDENNLNDGESEMVEDSEEINALLYSDSDDEYDYDDYDNDDDEANDGENYEVTSTRHTLLSLEDCINKDQLLEQVMEEEVASSDISPKRRKMLDGSCKKSSLAESYCDGGDIYPSKVKLHEAVKILGSIIPGGLRNKDPISIIEKAILYLETMKTEAKTLGLA